MKVEKRKYAERANYLKNAVKRRREKLRTMALQLKGGCCEVCGYNRCGRALSFHHLDPKKKDFGIGTQGYTRSWTLIKAEIEKCKLLCMNCHMELHDRESKDGE